MRTAIAALAAFALVGCTLLVAWHRAETLHGVCAEHGDQIHLTRTQADAAPPRPADAGEARLVTGSYVPQDGDFHCDVVATAFGVVAAHGGDDHQTDVGPVPGDALALAAPAPRGARYRLAPKASPPA